MATWVAANGDELFVTVSGILVRIPDGRTATQALATFDGGTGRFIGATGEAAATRGINEPAIRLDGWIEYEASNRSGR